MTLCAAGDPSNPADWDYAANALNQYTATTNPTESFSYDEDGNLTQDGTYHYTWDAENRLSCVQTGDPNSPVNGDVKVEFRYDYMGRRFEKKVSTHDGSDWNVTYTRRFVWSDWLPVLELEGGVGVPPANVVLRKYTWGLDLAGQAGGQTSGLSDIDAAGGTLDPIASRQGQVGGLLAAYDTNGTPGTTADDKSYLYFYDATLDTASSRQGQASNVGQLLDRSDGSIAAKYEYDAYGNVTASAGDYADDNPFRFSTKYWDDETGLGYWGFRYYSPRLGRWISRDPIEEVETAHLYLYAHDAPPLSYDSLGLAARCVYTPAPRPGIGVYDSGFCKMDVLICSRKTVTLPVIGGVGRAPITVCNDTWIGPRDMSVAGMKCKCRWAVCQLCRKVCCAVSFFRGKISVCQSTVVKRCDEYSVPSTYGTFRWLPGFGGFDCDCPEPTGQARECCGRSGGREIH